MSEEVVDPAVAIREKCEKSECASLAKLVDECNKRVTSNPGSTESCQEEFFDFLKCVDNCAAPKIFAKLK